MSTVYGNSLDKALEGRKFEGGLLKNEVEDGRVWPPRDPNEAVCFMNQKPKESRCHKTRELPLLIMILAIEGRELPPD